MSISVQNVERFKFIVHKIIPLVYDDSLSYYEFLCKVMQKLNEVISSLDNQNEILKAFDTEILDWETSTDNKYNQFVNNINALFEAFKQGEVAARTAFMDALIGNYNANTHYAVGQYVRYGDNVYKCTTATSGEAWNPAHWTQVVYADDMSERQDEFETSIQAQWDAFFDHYLQTLGVVQITGTSTTDVMSQKAVTDGLNDIIEDLTELKNESYSWIQKNDAVFSSLTINQKKTLLHIKKFEVKTYIAGAEAYIYNVRVNSDGSIDFAFGLTYNGIEQTRPVSIPASNILTTYSFNFATSVCRCDVNIEYTTKDITPMQNVTPSNSRLKIRVSTEENKLYSSTSILDSRIILNARVSKNVEAITIKRIQNIDRTISGSSYWYYAVYEVTLKDGTIHSITKSSVTQITGVLEETIDNFAVLLIDSDILALYRTNLQSLNLNLNLRYASWYNFESNYQYSLKNNLSTDGISNLNNVKIYKNGVSNISNYGKDNVRYVFDVFEPKKPLHLYFEYQFTEPPVYISNDLYYTLASISNDGVKAVTWFRQINQTDLRRFTIIGSSNGGYGNVSKTLDSLTYNPYSGTNTAFWIQYTGETATSQSDVKCRFANNTVTIYHGNTQTVIGTATYLNTDSVDSLIDKLNLITGISCGGIETSAHICSELLLSEEETTFDLYKSYTDDSNVTQYDYPKISVYYSMDNNWHSLEILVDIDNEKSYCSFDGNTVESTIKLNRMTTTTIQIGGTYNGTETPIRVRNLQLDFNGFGDAEIVESVAPPYTTIHKQLISNHNPRLLIFEGHGVDVGVDSEAPYSDDMAVTTDRLNVVFSKLREKGYVPVTWKEIIDWKKNNKTLPKRCYNLMLDDWRFENFVDYEKRKPFNSYNVKAGLAVTSSSKDVDETVVIDDVEYTVKQIIEMTMNAGWYPCSHTKNHRRLKNVKPSELEALLKEDVIDCDKHGIYSDVIVYPYGSFNMLTNFEVERSTFKIGVNIVTNNYNCKAKNDYNLTRVEIGTREPLANVLIPIV